MILYRNAPFIIKTLPATVNEPSFLTGGLDWILGSSTGHPSVTTPRSVRDVWMWHLGNELVLNTSVLGEWLDLMMLEVFSLLNDLTTHLNDSNHTPAFSLNVLDCSQCHS